MFLITGRISPRNFMNTYDEMIAALPKEKFSKAIKEKIATSSDFKAFYELLTNPEFQKRIDAVLDSPKLQPQFEILKQNGIDLKTVQLKLRKVIAWGKL